MADSPALQHWSIILKVLYARRGENPSDSHYWKREAEVYQSGLLDNLPDQLAAARCWGVMDYPDEACWLWLEDVQDKYPGRWPSEIHIRAAHHLGQFSSLYLKLYSLPHFDWLSRDWVRRDVNRFGSQALHLDDLRQHPLVHHWLPEAVMMNLRRLWREREQFLTALDGLPQTLCHYDAFRRNLFARSEQTVIVDWSFVGVGPLGAELVAPFWVNAIFEEIDHAHLKSLSAALFDSYVAGLRDAGWQGDLQQVRLGYCAALGLRRLAGVGIQATEIAAKLADGQPISESYIESMLQAGQIIDTLVDEARALLDNS